MKKLLFSLFMGGLIISSAYAQESRFFIPKEVEAAYKANTRSMTGAPGSAYWQNTVDYTISAELDPTTRKISGSLQATYHNNSPNELPTLVVRLYHDVFKKGNKRLMAVDESDIGEGVNLVSVSVNGTALDLTSRQVNRQGTNLYISLSEPLAAGQTLTFATEWSYIIPATLRRTGMKDSSSYHVGYWYPQISVYDDIFGWDTFDYTFQREFYNNLANFDVTIKAPKNVTVWATGVLQNEDEIFNSTTLERYQQAKTSTDVVHIITDEDLDSGYSNNGDTWHYKASEVSDFAFSVSDHYLWDAAVQKVEDRDVFISSVFPKGQAEAYKEVTTNQQLAMKYFSEGIPGVPYPYPAFTTFIGLNGGGMEFPMMANNAGPNLGVTVHEMFHTYFPMYVRINEPRYSYMDEGWAQYMTDLVIARYFEDNNKEVFDGLVSGTTTMGSTEDLPLITSSQFMDDSNWGYAAYSLPGFFYGMLHHYLGDEMFLKCYRGYINRWATKSPTPYDFMYTFEDISGEDLSWLWNPWFFNYGHADLAIGTLNKSKLTINMMGNRPVPLKLDVYYNDGSTKSIVENAKIWTKGKSYIVTLEKPKDIDFMILSQGVPDEVVDNNLYPAITEIYKKVTIDADVVGSYQIDNYPLTMELSKNDEGVLALKIPRTGIAGDLLPMGDNKFRTLDGALTVDLVSTNGKITAANMDYQGFKLTAQKK